MLASGSNQAWAVDSNAQAGSPLDAMASSYAEDFGVKPSEARQRLLAQERLVRALPSIQKDLGPAYAGLWYDNEDGRVKAGLTDPKLRGGLIASLRSRGLAGDADVVNVRSTWNELLAAQAQLARELRSSAESERFQLGIVAGDNAVELSVGSEIAQERLSGVERLADSSSVRVDVIERPKRFFDVRPSACYFPDCDRPLRAGVRFYNPNMPGCSTGFVVTVPGPAYGVLTAGHCFRTGAFDLNLATHATTGIAWPIGLRTGSYLGPAGDDAVMTVTGGNWLTSTLPAGRVAVWGFDHMWPITSAGLGAYGVYIARSGATSGYAAGTIQATNVNNVYYTPLDVWAPWNPVGSLTRSNACASPGDSGGPVWSANTAIGIVAAGSCTGATELYHSEVIPALNRYGAALAAP